MLNHKLPHFCLTQLSIVRNLKPFFLKSCPRQSLNIKALIYVGNDLMLVILLTAVSYDKRKGSYRRALQCFGNVKSVCTRMIHVGVYFIL